MVGLQGFNHSQGLCRVGTKPGRRRVRILVLCRKPDNLRFVYILNTFISVSSQVFSLEISYDVTNRIVIIV